MSKLNNYEKKISFLLDEQSDFQSLISKIEKIFKTSLIVKNHDGRLIASGDTDYYHIQIVDKYDDLSPILCDEYYSLKLCILSENFSYEEEESKIIKIFFDNNITWIKGTWFPIELTSSPRKIYP